MYIILVGASYLIPLYTSKPTLLSDVSLERQFQGLAWGKSTPKVNQLHLIWWHGEFVITVLYGECCYAICMRHETPACNERGPAGCRCHPRPKIGTPFVIGIEDGTTTCYPFPSDLCQYSLVLARFEITVLSVFYVRPERKTTFDLS